MEHVGDTLRRTGRDKAQRLTPTVSAALDDGRLVEMFFDAGRRTTGLVVARDGAWELAPELVLPDGRCLRPLSPANNLLAHDVLLLPSEPEEYGDKQSLLARIQEFIHCYVDISALFERIAAHYVLLSWLYDGFHEVPYLRVMGEPGSGKTRFLLTVGSLCYKPIFASGASTVAPLFRMLDTIRGTLVIDEADLRVSDERAEVIKILNNGTCRGFPVLRAESNPKTGEFNPTAFHVFGPKIVGTRGQFDDRALETRFLSERLGAQRLREDIPIRLTDGHALEARTLRNQLLLFRLRHAGHSMPLPSEDRAIEPRLNQMFGPLLAVIDDVATRQQVLALARTYHSDGVAARGLEPEGIVVEALHDLYAASRALPSLRALAELIAQRQGTEMGTAVTPRWVGFVLRRKLGITTVRRREGYVIAPSENAKLPALFERFGVGLDEPPTPSD